MNNRKIMAKYYTSKVNFGFTKETAPQVPNFIIWDSTEQDLFHYVNSAWVKLVPEASSIVYGADKDAIDLIPGSDKNPVAVTSNDGVIYGWNGTEWVKSEPTYENEELTTIAAGGIPEGSDLFSKGPVTFEQFVKKLCYAEVNANVSKASAKIAPTGFSNGGSYEVGTSLDAALTVSFNSKGSISPLYEEKTGKKLQASVAWAGDATSYKFTDAYGGTTGIIKTVGTDDEATATNCVVDLGQKVVEFNTQTFKASITYTGSGYNVYTSDGNLQESNNGGTTSVVSCSYKGFLPWFATTSAINTLTRQSSQILSNTTNVQIGSGGTGFVTEAGGGGFKQAVLLPATWYTRSPVKWSQYNTLSGLWDEYTSKFEVKDATIDWNAMTVTVDGIGTYSISGNTPLDTTNQSYKFIVNTDVTFGDRSVRFIK